MLYLQYGVSAIGSVSIDRHSLLYPLFCVLPFDFYFIIRFSKIYQYFSVLRSQFN